MDLNYRTIGLSHQSELVTSTSANRLTSFSTSYGVKPHFSSGVTKSSSPYNNSFSQVSYPLNPMRYE